MASPLIHVILGEALKPLEALRPELAAAAQKVYDEWDQSEPEFDDLGGGGICQDIAQEMAQVLDHYGYDSRTVSQQIDEQHVYVITAHPVHGIYRVDIYPGVYETGGGYTWTKREGVVIEPSDVDIDLIDSDPAKLSDYDDL